MQNLKSRILMTACAAFVGVTGLASSASAASSAIYGGGSSLVAPYWRQTADCYGVDTDLIIKGTPPTFLDPPDFNYVGTGAQNCATKHIKPTLTVNYISTGSGTGIAGLFSHDPTFYGEIDGSGHLYPSTQYDLSDAGLSASDVQIWNVTGGTEHGATVAAFGGTPDPYPNPLQTYGPMVQFPLSVDPVTFAYDPAYEKVVQSDGVTVVTYHFNIKSGIARSSGGLRLDQATYCKIFNGLITNWNDPIFKTLNGNQSLQDPADTGTFSVPIEMVGRSDSSGTTSIFYRHLATACASLSGNQFLPAGGTTLPSGLIGNTYNPTNPNWPSIGISGKFTVAPGSSGVAQYVAFTAVPSGAGTAYLSGRLAYLGPDYVLPAVLNTGANNYNLNTATLKNKLNQWEAPTPVSALKALGSVSPPQSNANGTYCSSCGTKLRANPQDWVEPIDNSSPLGNPAVTGAYPVVGTTNFLGYQCYHTPGSLVAVNGMMGYVDSAKINIDPRNGILASAGLSPLPSNWRTAVKGTFLNNSNGLGLNFGEAQVTAGNCSVSGVVGG